MGTHPLHEDLQTAAADYTVEFPDKKKEPPEKMRRRSALPGGRFLAKRTNRFI